MLKLMAEQRVKTDYYHDYKYLKSLSIIEIVNWQVQLKEKIRRLEHSRKYTIAILKEDEDFIIMLKLMIVSRLNSISRSRDIAENPEDFPENILITPASFENNAKNYYLNDEEQILLDVLDYLLRNV